jgi:hypothetical protein
MARYGYLKPLIIPLCLFVLTGALFKLEEFLLNTEILSKQKRILVLLAMKVVPFMNILQTFGTGMQLYFF